MTDMTLDSVNPEEFFNAGENPALNNAVVAQALAEPEQEIPSITPPDSYEFNRLPAGMLVGDKNVREFEVQELTGAHEERLSRVNRITEPGRWMQTLLECGVVSVAGQEATPDLLKGLLLGDRDYLSLAIRAATYGTEVELGTVQCPRCGEAYDLNLDIRDIPVREFDGVRLFEVPLRKGGTAKVSLPDGNTQLALFEDGSLTTAEQKSILLAESVQMIGHNAVAGFPSLVKNLSVVDRNAIVNELDKRQPGPRYNEIKRQHACGFEAAVEVGPQHLFPGL